MIERALERHATLLFGVSTLLLVAVYLIVGGIYRPANGDDGWSLSFLYQYHLHGVEHDTVFGNVVPSAGGQDGVFHFAKIQSFVYGAILDVAGWTRSAAHAVSTLLIGASALIWGIIAQRITAHRYLSTALVILLLLSEPLFGPANQSRPEALTFFFASAAFALFLYERPFFSGLFIGLAFEVHPAGLFAGLYVASAFLAKLAKGDVKNQMFSRSTALLVSGVVLSFSLYALLHIEAIATLRSVALENNQGTNFLWAYFVNTKYSRHIPELLFILMTTGLFIAKKHWKEESTLAWLLLGTGFSLLVFHRGNFHYTLYSYAPLMLTSLWVAARYKKLFLTFCLCLMFFVAQYAAVYYLNRLYSFDAYAAKISKAVPNDGLAVVGTSNDWFIFQERVFYANKYQPEAFSAVAPSAFYLIQNSSFSKPEFYANIYRTFRCNKLSGFALGGQSVQVDRCER